MRRGFSKLPNNWTTHPSNRNNKHILSLSPLKLIFEPHTYHVLRSAWPRSYSFKYAGVDLTRNGLVRDASLHLPCWGYPHSTSSRNKSIIDVCINFHMFDFLFGEDFRINSKLK